MRIGVKILAIGVLFYGIFSCNPNPKISLLTEGEEKKYLDLGNEISNHIQTELLKKVSKAIEKGGTDGAVAYCNINAIPVTDSISKIHQVEIQRLSDRNRNPQNEIKQKQDILAWDKIKEKKMDFIEQDSLGGIYYYKPIAIKMPTCIQCHGGKENISESTQKIISEKYPNDKAIGYQINDMRGMWKIKLK